MMLGVMFNNVFINQQRHFKKCYLNRIFFISIIVGQIIQTDKYTVFKQISSRTLT